MLILFFFLEQIHFPPKMAQANTQNEKTHFNEQWYEIEKLEANLKIDAIIKNSIEARKQLMFLMLHWDNHSAHFMYHI